MKICFTTLVDDESGAETVEYALVLGLVALAAAAAIAIEGTKLSTWWRNASVTIGLINSSS